MFLSFTQPKFSCCFTQSKWKNIACTEDGIRHTLRWDVIRQFGEILINRLWHLKFDIYLTGRSSATGQNKAAKCPAVILNQQVCIWNHKWITNKFRDFINSKVPSMGEANILQQGWKLIKLGAVCANYHTKVVKQFPFLTQWVSKALYQQVNFWKHPRRLMGPIL